MGESNFDLLSTAHRHVIACEQSKMSADCNDPVQNVGKQKRAFLSAERRSHCARALDEVEQFDLSMDIQEDNVSEVDYP